MFFGRSEMPEQSLSSKCFCIIVLHDCVPKQQASASESNDSIYCVSFAHFEAQVIYRIWKLLYSVASPTFLSGILCQFIRKWRFCSLWLVGWKRCFSCKCFMQPRLIGNTCLYIHFCNTVIMYLAARFAAVSKWNVQRVALKHTFNTWPWHVFITLVQARIAVFSLCCLRYVLRPFIIQISGECR